MPFFYPYISNQLRHEEHEIHSDRFKENRREFVINPKFSESTPKFQQQKAKPIPFHCHGSTMNIHKYSSHKYL